MFKLVRSFRVIFLERLIATGFEVANYTLAFINEVNYTDDVVQFSYDTKFLVALPSERFDTFFLKVLIKIKLSINSVFLFYCLINMQGKQFLYQSTDKLYRGGSWKVNEDVIVVDVNVC